MKICGLEKFSMVDFGDKISCTVFTGGCNMRCPFCHNGALVIGEQEEAVSEEYVFDYLVKRKGLLDAVCVTGGESTLQPDLPDFLKRVKDIGYIVKVDSNGLRPQVLRRIIREGLVDYVAMDIKNSPAKYPLTTGVKNIDMSKIYESVELIMSEAKAYEFRTTAIAEFHTFEDMLAISEWLSGAKKYVIQKYVDSEGCIEHGFTPVDKKDAEAMLALFDGKVGEKSLRGYNT